MSIKNKFFLPILVLAVFIVIAQLVSSNPPQTKRGKPNKVPQLSVDVQTIKPRVFDVTVHSYGLVKPRTQSILLPQVSGQILKISDKFRAGGFFETGDILIELDDRDLQAELNIAKASLFNAKSALSEEEARVEQAKQDWQRLGQGEIAPNLVLRKPQLLAAQAQVLSSQASLTKAQLSLERSKIVAPFTGRVLVKHVDVGQVISQNTQLAEIYAVDYVEVRLPIKNKDLPYMILPENSRVQQVNASQQPSVTIFSDLVTRQSWQGKIVRTEGAFDSNSQQLFVVAQIDDPYGTTSEGGLPLKIGQYVSAEISGKRIDDAFIVPNKAIYQGSYLYLVKDNLLQKREIDIAWQNKDFALLENGFSTKYSLVTTPLGQVTSGILVNINAIDGKKTKPSIDNKNKQRRRKNNSKGQGSAEGKDKRKHLKDDTPKSLGESS